MKASSYSIVIADTQFLVVESLKSLLGADERFSVTGVVLTYGELIKILDQSHTDLLITDTSLLDYKGEEELLNLKIKYPKLALMILTNVISKSEFSELNKIGIKNILYKTAEREEILSAVEAACKGKKYYSEEVLDLMIELSESRSIPEEPSHLTGSEIEIVKLIAAGMTTREIAEKRCISFHTVNTHRKNIFRKLGVTNSSELIMHAIKAGWIDNIEYFI